MIAFRVAAFVVCAYVAFRLTGIGISWLREGLEMLKPKGRRKRDYDDI